MSVNPISTYGAGAASSSSTQTTETQPDGEATFADWLKQFQADKQSASQSTSNSNTAEPGLFPLSNATASFAAHLPNGLTIGIVALGPVSSSQAQEMARSVEQQALDALNGSASSNVSWPDTSSSTENNNSAALTSTSGPMGMYELLSNGVELMGYSAGTTNGGPNLQDLNRDMGLMRSTLEKALNPSDAA